MPERLAAKWRTAAGLGHIAGLTAIAEMEEAARLHHDEWTVPRGLAELLSVPNEHVQLLARELVTNGTKGGKS
jgi:hypothetical protein